MVWDTFINAAANAFERVWHKPKLSRELALTMTESTPGVAVALDYGVPADPPFPAATSRAYFKSAYIANKFADTVNRHRVTLLSYKGHYIVRWSST